MTDCTKICSKLVYSQKLGYITESTLPSSEISVSDINDIQKKICYIYENDEFATQIFNIFCIVLDFACQNNLNILSIGADDAKSEFNAQIKIMNLSSTYFTFDDPFYNVHFKVPIIHKKPLVCIQDLKHAKKIAQNQLFTRARLLLLGIDTVRYDQLY